MKFNPEEGKGATFWFFGVGLVAVVFSFVLYSVDNMLSYSPRDKILGETLHELRSAQTSLASAVTDPRQLAISRGDIPSGTTAESADEHH